MKKVTVIEVVPKSGYEHTGASVRLVSAPVVCMAITEDESKDKDRLKMVHDRMLKEERVNLKFIVIPNGKFLPALASHYVTT
jgi:hypothetical protein